MGDVRDEQAEVTETLIARFPTVEPEVIHEHVKEAFPALRSAPVQAYTAVLVQGSPAATALIRSHLQFAGHELGASAHGCRHPADTASRSRSTNHHPGVAREAAPLSARLL